MSRLQRQTAGKKTRRIADPVFDEIHAEVMAKVHAFFTDPKRVARWKRRLKRGARGKVDRKPRIK